MFQLRPALVVALVVCGLLPVTAVTAVGGDKIKIENPGGFRTAMSGEHFRAYWDSLKDQQKMKGKVSDHLTKEQIETITVLEVNIAVADGPKSPSLQDELLAFMTECNRFETGSLPDGFDQNRPPKLVVAMFRTQKGDLGLITRYSKLTVVELKGFVGVAPSP